jgi:NitT/TauT family transport system substrate-binding protein
VKSHRLLLSLLVFVISACTPDKDAGQGSTIELLLDWKAQMEHAGFFVAISEGYYRSEDISVEILEGNGAPTTARLVGNGTYQLGVSSGSATVMARSKGIPVVSLAVINQHSPVVVYSLAASGITHPEDLIGKKIGVNIGGTKHREFQALLRHLNISEDKIQVMGMTESSPAPLLAGQVDAMLGYTEDQPVTIELRGERVNRILLADHGIDLYSTNIIGNETFVSENEDLVRRFVRASLRGWRKAVENPEAAVDAYILARPESDAAFNRANFQKLLPILDSPDVQTSGIGAQTAARWTATRDILVGLGMVEHPPTIDALFTTRFQWPSQ